MKSKVLKFVMPVFAFILAIGLAFATEVEDNSRIGYYEDPLTGEPQKVMVDCDSSISELCEYENHQVFGDENFTVLIYKSDSK